MKKLMYGFVLLSMLLGLPACTQTTTANQEAVSIELTDALGRDIVLESLPSTIIVAGKQTPMIIDLLYLFPDADVKLAGIENRSQTTKNFLTAIFPESAGKVNLEKDAGAEQIAALHPDLVILKTSMAEEIGAGLETLSIPILYVSLESIPEIETDIRNMGRVMGDDERAQEILSLYTERTESIMGKVDQNETEMKDVLLLQYSEDNGEVSFEVPPASWLQTNLVEMAGGNPVWIDAVEGGGWATVNMEQIANWNPDVIFVINYFGNSVETVTQLQQNEVWQQLDATQNGELYGFPGDFISWDQPDARWILGFEWLAMKINPETFQDYDFMGSVMDFYQDFYGVEENTINENILPLVYGSF